VTPNGTVVWSHQTGGIPYEAERLPEGERAGADRYERGAVADPGGDVPVLSLAMVGIRSVFPGTPYWFAESHLGLVLLGLGLTVAGNEPSAVVPAVRPAFHGSLPALFPVPNGLVSPSALCT